MNTENTIDKSIEQPAEKDNNQLYVNNFIQDIIYEYIEKCEAEQKDASIQTRFPPEPNGYLHIGHAKSICLNFSMAEKFAGKCNLRFDDTNPEKENIDYMTSIQNDVKWLGFNWDKLCYASDYFEELYQMAVTLIKGGLAYIDSQNAEEIREGRGTLTKAGVNSPFRDRSIDENMDLFVRMKAGEFADGTHVLRVKIDMQSANINLRDPVIYRIRHAHHYRTGNAWCIYPMYDFTHGLSDMLESVTHSLCTLEFEDHRPLYDWLLEKLDTPCKPRQIEFSRLQLEYTVLSKRRLIQLVEQNHVAGWDDPRMPTIAGLRRRGVPAQALRSLCYKIGINKKDAIIEIAYFDGIIRDLLNETAKRRMAVLDPIKLTINNYVGSEKLSIANHPQNEDLGKRQVEFSGNLFIEATDFTENAPTKDKRLELGSEIRLRGAYIVKCDEVIRDKSGRVVELICSYDPNTLGKKPEGRKVKGVIHWVNQATAIDATINEYTHLFTQKNPMASDNFTDCISKDSHKLLKNVKVESSLLEANVGETFQFERIGYYTVDNASSVDQLVFNSTIGLRE